MRPPGHVEADGDDEGQGGNDAGAGGDDPRTPDADAARAQAKARAAATSRGTGVHRNSCLFELPAHGLFAMEARRLPTCGGGGRGRSSCARVRPHGRGWLGNLGLPRACHPLLAVAAEWLSVVHARWRPRSCPTTPRTHGARTAWPLTAQHALVTRTADAHSTDDDAPCTHHADPELRQPGDGERGRPGGRRLVLRSVTENT